MNTLFDKISPHLLTLFGVVLLIIGIPAAFFAPVEIYCYYLFSEGGWFHYEGFGFGSFMFGNITMQIWAYYIIALICIPLGYGHLKKQGWVQKISLTYLWCWLIVGIPLLPMLLFILVTSKEPSLLLFQGIFPLYGKWLIGLKSFIIISLSILLFVFLIIGTLNRKMWSWWGALIYFSFFITSSITTLLFSDFSKIVTLLNFPVRETDALINIPLKGLHLSAIFGILLLLTFGLIIFSKNIILPPGKMENQQQNSNKKIGFLFRLA